MRSRTAPEPARSARSVNRVVATSSGRGPTCITCSPGTAKLPAGGEHRAGPRQQVLGHRGRPIDEVLAVVQHDHCRGGRKQVGNRLREFTPAGSTIPRAAATARATASVSAPVGNKARSAKAAAVSGSARKTKRVLPTPPGPTKVTSRYSPRAASRRRARPAAQQTK